MGSSSSMEKSSSSTSTLNTSVKNYESLSYIGNDEGAAPPNADFNSNSQIEPNTTNNIYENNTREIMNKNKINDTTIGNNIDPNSGGNWKQTPTTKGGMITKTNINPNEGGQSGINVTVGNTVGENNNIDRNIGVYEETKKPKPSTNTGNDNIFICGNQKYYDEDNKKPSTNTGGNDNVDINLGGNMKFGQEGTPTKPTDDGNIDMNRPYIKNNGNDKFTPTQGNIDYNLGGSSKINEDYNKPETKTGNLDRNMGGNKYVTNTTKGSTTKPNIDSNIPYDEDQKEETKDNLSLSQTVQRFTYDLDISDPDDITKLKIHASQKVSEGFFPLFLKINREKPHFFFVKENSTLRILLDYYHLFNGTKKGNIVLFKGNNKLDLDTQIQNLNLPMFSIIVGYE